MHDSAITREKGRKRTKGGRRLLNRLLLGPRWIKRTAADERSVALLPSAMDPRATPSPSSARSPCAASGSGMHRRPRNRVQMHPTLSDGTCNDRQRSLATLNLHIVSRASRACLVHSPSARSNRPGKGTPLDSHQTSSRQTVDTPVQSLYTWKSLVIEKNRF